MAATQNRLPPKRIPPGADASERRDTWLTKHFVRQGSRYDFAILVKASNAYLMIHVHIFLSNGLT
jgi:hypothetical protein